MAKRYLALFMRSRVTLNVVSVIAATVANHTHLDDAVVDGVVILRKYVTIASKLPARWKYFTEQPNLLCAVVRPFEHSISPASRSRLSKLLEDKLSGVRGSRSDATKIAEQLRQDRI